MLAVDRPGEDLGTGGLPGPPGTGEEIGVGQPSGSHLPLEGIGNVGLAHHIVEGPGPPFAV